MLTNHTWRKHQNKSDFIFRPLHSINGGEVRLQDIVVQSPFTDARLLHAEGKGGHFAQLNFSWSCYPRGLELVGIRHWLFNFWSRFCGP